MSLLNIFFKSSCSLFEYLEKCQSDDHTLNILNPQDNEDYKDLLLKTTVGIHENILYPNRSSNEPFYSQSEVKLNNKKIVNNCIKSIVLKRQLGDPNNSLALGYRKVF